MLIERLSCARSGVGLIQDHCNKVSTLTEFTAGRGEDAEQGTTALSLSLSWKKAATNHCLGVWGKLGECLTRGRKDKVTKKRHGGKNTGQGPEGGKGAAGKGRPSPVSPLREPWYQAAQRTVEGRRRGTWSHKNLELSLQESTVRAVGLTLTPPKQCPPELMSMQTQQALASQTQLQWRSKIMNTSCHID